MTASDGAAVADDEDVIDERLDPFVIAKREVDAGAILGERPASCATCAFEKPRFR